MNTCVHTHLKIIRQAGFVDKPLVHGSSMVLKSKPMQHYLGDSTWYGWTFHLTIINSSCLGETGCIGWGDGEG